jgi:hypothetical protein
VNVFVLARAVTYAALFTGFLLIYLPGPSAIIRAILGWEVRTMSTQESSEKVKKLWKSVVGYTVTGLAVVGGFIGIYTFLVNYSRYDLSGKWIIINTIQSTSYHPYQGLKLGYTVFLTQHGTDITGAGEKESENGRDLPPAAHNHISITGSISGKKITATFVEEGTERKTEGTFDWTYSSGTNALAGTFTSTAADAAGPSAAHRAGPGE